MNPKSFVVSVGMFCLLCLTGGWVCAQMLTEASNAAERSRIGAQRAQFELTFNAENKACYEKFFVNNCLNKVKARRQEVLSDLKRQETALNDQDRKARGAEQVNKTEEKASLQKQREAADKAGQALRDGQDRQVREQQKNTDRAVAKSGEQAKVEALASRIKNNQEKAAARAVKQAGIAAEVKKFETRQAEALERKDRQAKDQGARTKPAAAPLPVPP